MSTNISRSWLFVVAVLGFLIFGAQLFSSPGDSIIEARKLEKKSIAQTKNFIKKYQGGRFTYISSGNFNYESPGNSFGLWVTGKTKETVQTARPIVLAFINAYVAELQDNKDIKTWYEYLCKTKPNYYSGNPSVKTVHMRIVFWDENVERPQAPYLAEIHYNNGVLQYYQADPKTHDLKLVKEESYEDAALNECNEDNE